MGLNYTKRARAVCGFTETTLREPGLYMGLDYTKRARTATSTFTQLLCSELYVHRNLRLIRDESPGRPPRLSHSS